MNRLSLAPTLAVSTRRATSSGDAASEDSSPAGGAGELCKNLEERGARSERFRERRQYGRRRPRPRTGRRAGARERAALRPDRRNSPRRKHGQTPAAAGREIEPVVQFLRNLSPESYTQRFHGAAKIDASLLDGMVDCDWLEQAH